MLLTLIFSETAYVGHICTNCVFQFPTLELKCGWFEGFRKWKIQSTMSHQPVQSAGLPQDKRRIAVGMPRWNCAWGSATTVTLWPVLSCLDITHDTVMTQHGSWHNLWILWIRIVLARGAPCDSYRLRILRFGAFHITMNCIEPPWSWQHILEIYRMVPEWRPDPTWHCNHCRKYCIYLYMMYMICIWKYWLLMDSGRWLNELERCDRVTLSLLEPACCHGGSSSSAKMTSRASPMVSLAHQRQKKREETDSVDSKGHTTCSNLINL